MLLYIYINEIYNKKVRSVFIMPRPRKEGHYVNVKLDDELYNRLTEHCDADNRTKTSVFERALVLYFEKIDREAALIEKDS